MSDGPHRSLPMSKRWKQVAERIYNEAYGSTQVGEALTVAVVDDWGREIPEALICKIKVVLSNDQERLFPDQRHQELERLRREFAGYPLAYTFIDYAFQALSKGQSGEGALLDSTCGTTTDFSARGLRQVEEHYHREAPRSRIIDVRRRIDQAIETLDTKAIARQILGIEVYGRPLKPAKHTGLDAGVPL